MEIIKWLNDALWSGPVLCLILGCGLYLTLGSYFAQVRLLPSALGRLARSMKKQGTGYASLCTALGATVGTGNIAGVAGAIAIGGPGVVLWMWVSGTLGMILKFAEASLAVRYRMKQSGTTLAGPMYVIVGGLRPRWHILAYVYAFLGAVAALGVGNATQINAVMLSVQAASASSHLVLPDAWPWIAGIILAVLVYFMLRRGDSGIGKLATALVPFAAGMYIVLGAVFLCCRADRIPQAMASIVRGAFSPRAVTGGGVCGAFLALRTGVSRGVFTNEAGMGTAGIAHGMADVEQPQDQGLMGIVEVFLDTLVICTVTALVILCSGVPIPYGTVAGTELTAAAFETVFGSLAQYLLLGAMVCFALATILGWGLYGYRCMEFLLPGFSWKTFAFFQSAIVLAGAVLKTELIWTVAELFNGLMALPNLTAIWLLRQQVLSMTSFGKNPWKIR